ncbi:hypothetical protein J5X07_11600 [Actinomyces bowdenii]|uniref:hypothetical protein n=1 Tax=Actinomyces bowdenii TaxID=131109 RepID=UPI001ABD3255|nr:hypothetical protein [Actinomyces bowdenii]MBO3725659.1 hypothetical protein [Actinomyces bowdenii]
MTEFEHPTNSSEYQPCQGTDAAPLHHEVADCSEQVVVPGEVAAQLGATACQEALCQMRTHNREATAEEKDDTMATVAIYPTNPTAKKMEKLRTRISQWWASVTWKPGDDIIVTGDPVDPLDPVACIGPKGARKYFNRYNIIDDPDNITTD